MNTTVVLSPIYIASNVISTVNSERPFSGENVVFLVDTVVRYYPQAKARLITEDHVVSLVLPNLSFFTLCKSNSLLNYS